MKNFRLDVFTILVMVLAFLFYKYLPFISFM